MSARNEEIEKQIAELFGAYEDDETITEYLEENEEDYSNDIYDFASRKAKS